MNNVANSVQDAFILQKEKMPAEITPFRPRRRYGQDHVAFIVQDAFMLQKKAAFT